jgi:hypothetical protein
VAVNEDEEVEIEDLEVLAVDKGCCHLLEQRLDKQLYRYTFIGFKERLEVAQIKGACGEITWVLDQGKDQRLENHRCNFMLSFTEAVQNPEKHRT